jgi:DNA-directed RNA polymerase subunit RPC12/RpoP
VPWCEQCDAEVETEELGEDETCPSCGSPTLEHRKQPWWFKFLAVATVIYLGYRAFQGITWVVHHA